MNDKANKQGPNWVRPLALVVCAAIVLPVVIAAFEAVGLSAFGLGVVVVGVLGGLLLLWGKLPRRLSGNRLASRVLFAAWIISGFFAATRLAMLSRFMLDPHKTEYCFDSHDDFRTKHNCFTCYVIADHLARENVDNLYDRSRYRDAEIQTPVHKSVEDLLTVDTYQYPPPFLLLSRALTATGLDFLQLRTVWFALNVLIFGGAMVAIALWCGLKAHPLTLSFPLVLAAPVTLLMFQIGNVHVMIIALAMLGMLALEKRRFTIGGLLLGFTIVAKLFPGVLAVYLLLQRRWRALLYTSLAMVLYWVASWLIVGTKPIEAFFTYQLPRLLNGDAFGFMREYLKPIIVNMSIAGIPYKLSKIEWIGADPQKVSAMLIWAYTAVLLGILAVVGLRHGRKRSERDGHGDDATPNLQANARQEDFDSQARLMQARCWLALLIFAQLRSPFLPWTYGMVPVLWLVTLLAPSARHNIWKAIPLLAIGVLLAIDLPIGDPTEKMAFNVTYTLTGTAVTLLLGLMAVWRRVGRTPPPVAQQFTEPPAQTGSAALDL